MTALPLDVKYLSYDDLRAKAEAFLNKHHPERTIPIPIEDIIELRLKIDIVPAYLDEIAIEAWITSDLEWIYVARRIYDSQNSNRYRFSLTHELAHAVLHPHIFKQLSFATIDEWLSSRDRMSDDENKWIEWQAYAFAGLVLVPRAELALEFKQATALLPGEFSAEAASEATIHALMRYLAPKFEVSPGVIERRCTHDGLISRPS